MMEAVSSSETLVITDYTTQHPQKHIHTRRRENLQIHSVVTAGF